MATGQQDDWLQRMLGVSLAALRADGVAAADDDEDDAEPVDDEDLIEIWAYARQAYHDASDEVDAQISQLQQALRQSDDVELEDIAERGLNGITGNTKVPLMAAIQDAGDGSRARLVRAAPKLAKAIQAFRAHLEGDERIEACDDNPFGIRVSIRDTFSDALDQLESAVARV